MTDTKAVHDNDATLRGCITAINEPVVYGSNGFKKASCILDTGGKYPQMIEVSFLKNNCDMLAKVQVGDVVSIRVHIGGREYNGRFYVSLNAYYMETLAPRQGQHGAVHEKDAIRPPPPAPKRVEDVRRADESEELPF